MTDNKIQESLMHFNSSFKSTRYCDFFPSEIYLNLEKELKVSYTDLF